MEKNTKTNIIHFEPRADNRIVIDINVSFYKENENRPTTKTISMLVATGTAKTLLNLDIAKSMGIDFNTKRKVKAKPQNAYHYETAYKYTIPGITLENNVIQVQNMDILLCDVVVQPQEYAGILGLDVFKDKKICFDFQNHNIEIE